MNIEDLRKEYYQVMEYTQPFGNEYHEEVFKWIIEKIEIERCSLNKEITNKDILLSKKNSELNEIRYGDETKKEFAWLVMTLQT